MAQITANNKISIYPIEVIIEGAGGPQNGLAYKINPMGMILEVFVSTFTPQQQLKLKWVLPIDHISMEEDVIVIKKYTQPRGDKIQYLMEVHFKKIKSQNAASIKGLLERYEVALKKQNEDKS